MAEYGIPSVSFDVPDAAPAFGFPAPSFGGGSFNFPNPFGGDTGGGGSNWLSGLGDVWKGVSGFAKEAAPFIGYGKDIGSVLLGIQRNNQMGDYNKALRDYYTRRSSMESDYNTAMMNYLSARSEWENQFMGSFQDFMGQTEGAISDASQQASDAIAKSQAIFGEALSAAKPLLAQSQELMLPAIAALARGEEPAGWKDVLDDTQNKAIAAAMQPYLNNGMDADAARAIVLPQVTAARKQMVTQIGGQLGQTGLATAQQGFGGLNVAGGFLDPIYKEFLGLQSVLGSIFGGGAQAVLGGGFPNLPSSALPPAPAVGPSIA